MQDTRVTSNDRSLGFSVAVVVGIAFTGLVALGAGWATALVVGSALLVTVLVADHVGVFASEVDTGPSSSLRLDAAERVRSRLEEIAAADRAASAFQPTAVEADLADADVADDHVVAA